MRSHKSPFLDMLSQFCPTAVVAARECVKSKTSYYD